MNKEEIHHYLIKRTFGIEYDQDIVCCGGFAYHKGNKDAYRKLKYSSVWLNDPNR